MGVSWLSQGEADLPHADDWLTARERERAAAMRYAKRRNDFLLARWTAKVAVARWMSLASDVASLAQVEIRNATDGAPHVLVRGQPAPLEIAMTDRAGWAVCALHAPGTRIGCDLELVEPRSDAFIADYFTAAEQATIVAATTDSGRHLLANLLWCAKESALKVLRTGLRRDTRSVEVRLEPTPPADGWRRLLVEAEEGPRFPGWWRQYGVFLLTVAAQTDTPPPVSIVHPPGLAHAAPTHSWLAAPLLAAAPLAAPPLAAARRETDGRPRHRTSHGTTPDE